MADLIVVDFDGTITERDTLDDVLEQYAPEAYEEAERGLSDGRLTLRECMAMEFAPVRGDAETIVAERRPRRGGAARVRRVRACRRGGRPSSSSSSRAGSSRSSARCSTARAPGHLPVYAHEARFTADGTTVEFRHWEDCDVCGEECKRSIVAGLRDGRRVVYIGDGYSDRCAAVAADRRFARRFLAEDLDRMGLAYTPFDDFHTVRGPCII